MNEVLILGRWRAVSSEQQAAAVDAALWGRRRPGTARRGGHDAVVCQIIENAPAEPVHA